MSKQADYEYINAIAARDRGEAIVPQATIDRLAMDAIAELMSGDEWDSHIVDDIANYVRLSGREIHDIDS